MKLITETLLNTVSGQAKENPRLRMNYNFHESMDAPIHRMLNALDPIHIYLRIVIRIRIKKKYTLFSAVACLPFCLMKKEM